jgi:Cu2+-exporting ATPase
VPTGVAAAGVREYPGAGLSLASDAGEIRLGSAEFCGVAATAAAGAQPELWLTRPGRPPCRFRFNDQLRPEAQAVVTALRAHGRRVLLLSGDRPAAVAAMAEAAGITQWEAALKPAEKSARLAALAAAGAKVLMVGDGLNDGPALAAAHASMSPASAADVCQVAADVVFQGTSLAAVTEVLATAERSGRLVRQNIALAILYNALAVPLAMAGMVTPLIAAVAMSSSSLLVVGNALRLARRSA